VRADTGPLLTESDLEPNGNARRTLAWESRRHGWCLTTPRPAITQGTARASRLEGEYRINTPHGEVICHPAFELIPGSAGATRRRTVRSDLLDSACSSRGGRPPDLACPPGILLRLERPRAARQRHADGACDVRCSMPSPALSICPAGNVLFPAPPAASITGDELPSAKRMARTLGLTERPLGPARWGSVTTRDLYRAHSGGKTLPRPRLDRLRCKHIVGPCRMEATGAKPSRDSNSTLTPICFMNPTAELAAVVLPVASSFEREALKIGFEIKPEAQSLIQFRPAVVPPPGEARPDTNIIFDLAARLGFAEQFWSGDNRCRLRHQLAPTGVTLEQCVLTLAVCTLPLQTRHAKHCRADANGIPRGFRHAVTEGRALFTNLSRSRLRAICPIFEEPQIGPVARPIWRLAFR